MSNRWRGNDVEVDIRGWPVRIEYRTFWLRFLHHRTLTLWQMESVMEVPSPRQVPVGGTALAAAIVMGMLAERGMGRAVLSTVAAMIIGNIVIYALGAGWLGSFIGFEKALAAGVMPFLYGDAVKIIVAAGLMPLAWRLVKAAKR
ncbi:MAG: biotin transporter BioY [Planctomycetia bacterium]|nr:biotin transporter BioY [Planctomycetia bacterium]